MVLGPFPRTCEDGTESGKKIVSRATEKGGNVQARSPEWSIRGVGYNGYGQSQDLTVAKL